MTYTDKARPTTLKSWTYPTTRTSFTGLRHEWTRQADKLDKLIEPNAPKNSGEPDDLNESGGPEDPN